MTIDTATQRQRLQNFQFRELFINPEMGWDNAGNAPFSVDVKDRTYRFQRIAEKAGILVLAGGWEEDGSIPSYAFRRNIEREVVKQAHEHLLIFTDRDETKQVWQWIKRESGKPAGPREEHFNRGQSGERLLQALGDVRFSLDDEYELTITRAKTKLEKAFDKDKVTKRFYERFKSEHEAFRDFVDGIQEQGDRAWYASLMLNRLMFIYFFQQQGFLNNDRSYLRTKLNEVQRARGENQFHSFYRHFLRKLFHEGFGQPEEARDAALDALIGDVPYLNGGFFDVHQLEQQYPVIDIPDEAFEKLFAFFDAYKWHLDERPIAHGDEINPDVLGYIFEKYINQKELGAYYTKEDITEYIGKNTIVPFLFDAAKKEVANAFKPGSYLWRLLQENPDDYIYDAVEKGVELALPPDIAAGVNDVSKRGGWNRPASPEYALPTETWREHVARRTRHDEVWNKIVDGEISEINDLITLNLDIRRFAEDVIRNAEGPEVVRAFYRAIEKISVLDPTCGSGAFLFAALNILEPLYEACLDRMEEFVASLALEQTKPHPEKFRDFRETLQQAESHPNKSYFILKQIVLNNLYGVDIVEEAVEICKLRLFLKLVAQLEHKEQIEPLPDIDFNIRCGNTLVGFARPEDVKKALKPIGIDKATGEQMAQKEFGFNFEDEFRRIDEAGVKTDTAFQRFHEMQSLRGMDAADFRDAKQSLQERLAELRSELNGYLAREYAITPGKGNPLYDAWVASHQPFHWFAEFYGIMKDGGFDAIIGNPPYVEYSKIRNDLRKGYRIRGYTTEACGNLYAFLTERSYELLKPDGRFGFIVQAPIVSTARMQSVRALLRDQSLLLAFSTYDDRPSKLFNGMNHCRLAIILSKRASTYEDHTKATLTTRYHKWTDEERAQLFETIRYVPFRDDRAGSVVPKCGSPGETALYKRLEAYPLQMKSLLAASQYEVFYKITGVGHWFTFTLVAPRFWRDGVETASSRENKVSFKNANDRNIAFCVLHSTTHYWYYQARSNCRDFNPSDLESVPIAQSISTASTTFDDLASSLANRLEETSAPANATYKIDNKTHKVRYQQFTPRFSKPIIDKIDRLLAHHFGFTDEELDFIINYDIKYRMGADGGEGA